MHAWERKVRKRKWSTDYLLDIGQGRVSINWSLGNNKIAVREDLILSKITSISKLYIYGYNPASTNNQLINNTNNEWLILAISYATMTNAL